MSQHVFEMSLYLNNLTRRDRRKTKQKKRTLVVPQGAEIAVFTICLVRTR